MAGSGLQYSQTTYAAAVSSLAQRLQDPNNVHWTIVELTNCITESLRTFQSLTASYRERVEIPLVANTPFYDLSTIGSISPLFGYSVTDSDLLIDISFSLLETPGQYTGQFTQSQIVSAIQRRRDQWLLDTSSIITRQQISGASPTTGRVQLPQAVIDVKRVAIVDPYKVYTTLYRDDLYSGGFLSYGWIQQPGKPTCYTVSDLPPLTLEFIPHPISNYMVDLLLINSGNTLTGNGVLLGVPDDFCWGIKYGALADLLSNDGQSADPTRAGYCEKRYQESVQAAISNPSVLNVQCNGVQSTLGTVYEMDSYQTNWQNVTGNPYYIGMAGRNIFATLPVPQVNSAMTADLVRNMPVNGTYLQVGLELYEPILDYAQHIAMFKDGNQSLQSSIGLYQNMISAAKQINGKLNSISLFNKQESSKSVQAPRVEVPIR